MTAFLHSIGYGQWILHALVLLPLAGVVPILLGNERSARWTALVVTTLEFVLSVGLWWAMEPGVGAMQLVSNTPWIPAWGIGVPRGHRRHLARHGAAHHGPHAAQRAGELALHHHPRARVLRPHAHAADRPGRGVHRARHVPVLRLLRAHADSDVLHHRDLGRNQPAVRRHQVLRLHDDRLAPDARGDRRPRVEGAERHRPAVVLLRPPAGARERRRLRRALAVRGVRAGLRDQGADLPVPHLAARRPRRGADRRQRAAGGRHAQDRDLRLPPLRQSVLPRGGVQSGGQRPDDHPRGHRDHLRGAGGDGAAGHQEARGLLFGEPSRLRDAGHLGRHRAERAGRAHGDDQSRLLDRCACSS